MIFLANSEWMVKEWNVICPALSYRKDITTNDVYASFPEPTCFFSLHLSFSTTLHQRWLYTHPELKRHWLRNTFSWLSKEKLVLNLTQWPLYVIHWLLWGLCLKTTVQKIPSSIKAHSIGAPVPQRTASFSASARDTQRCAYLIVFSLFEAITTAATIVTK